MTSGACADVVDLCWVGSTVVCLAVGWLCLAVGWRSCSGVLGAKALGSGSIMDHGRKKVRGSATGRWLFGWLLRPRGVKFGSGCC